MFDWIKKLLFSRGKNNTDPAQGSNDSGTTKSVRILPKNSLRKWLAENNYGDVVEIMDNIRTVWDMEGKGTRRNWWDVLSGDSKGQSRTIEGFKMPVLRIAQIRQGKKITMNALCRNEDETLPDFLQKGTTKKIPRIDNTSRRHSS